MTIVLLCAFSLMASIPLSLAALLIIRRYEEVPEKVSIGLIHTHRLWMFGGAVATVACTLLIYHRYGVSAQTVAGLLLSYTLLLLSLVDLRTFLLPDFLTLPLILLGIGQGALGLFTPLDTALIGAAAGYGAPWLINTLFRLIRKKDGMGGGDFKLLAALGAWAGWAQLPLIIFLASFIGLVFALINRVGKQQPFPFGPALAAAGLLCQCYGKEFLDWYMGIAG